MRAWLDLEHMDKKKSPFDFEGWEDYWSEVRHYFVFSRCLAFGLLIARTHFPHAFALSRLLGLDDASQATPQQENGFDCGVFTCQFMEGTSRGEDSESFGFSQGDMSYLRKRMLWEIGEQRLAGWKIAASVGAS